MSIKQNIKNISKKLANKEYPFFKPLYAENPSDIKYTASKLNNKFTHFIIFGFGGSIYAGKTFASVSKYKNKFTFVDSIDPDYIDEIFDGIKEIEKTCFIFISKSGNTPELLYLYDLTMEFIGGNFIKDRYLDNFLIITQNKNNELYKKSYKNKHKYLHCSPDIGGRFSYLSITGMLIAELAELNTEEIYKGAQDTIDKFLNSPDKEQLGFLKTLSQGMMSGDIVGNVSIVYKEFLLPFQHWYRQLWAESIGKDGLGSLLIDASGVRDQHSQLQLYLEGRNNLVFTIIYLNDSSEKHITLNNDAKSLIKILDGKQRVVREISLPEKNEYHLSCLMTQMILETLLCADILGIDPFSQPSVDEMKFTNK